MRPVRAQLAGALGSTQVVDVVDVVDVVAQEAAAINSSAIAIDVIFMSAVYCIARARRA